MNYDAIHGGRYRWCQRVTQSVDFCSWQNIRLADFISPIEGHDPTPDPEWDTEDSVHPTYCAETGTMY